MTLRFIDGLIIADYIVFMLGLGFLLRRRIAGSTDFFLAGRSMPAWTAGLAFLSANLGAQEMIGMAASGAKYGVLTNHFYWIGAIPAMVFVGVFMMPFYYGSRARSVPEYLKFRFDEKTRAFNAITFAVMTVFSSGISMYAMGALLRLLLGWNIHASIAVSAVVVLLYIAMGGLTSAIYNEVVQFFLIVFGFTPLVFLGLREAGGWGGLMARVPDSYLHAWTTLGAPADNAMGVEWFGTLMGLGFVLSFGYWCTDFLVVQRAMAADSMNAARRSGRCSPKDNLGAWRSWSRASIDTDPSCATAGANNPAQGPAPGSTLAPTSWTRRCSSSASPGGCMRRSRPSERHQRPRISSVCDCSTETCAWCSKQAASAVEPGSRFRVLGAAGTYHQVRAGSAGRRAARRRTPRIGGVMRRGPAPRHHHPRTCLPARSAAEAMGKWSAFGVQT